MESIADAVLEAAAVVHLSPGLAEFRRRLQVFRAGREILSFEELVGLLQVFVRLGKASAALVPRHETGESEQQDHPDQDHGPVRGFSAAASAGASAGSLVAARRSTVHFIPFHFSFLFSG